MSTFPWDTMKAETLRSVAKEIGLAVAHKRDDLVRLLRMVEDDGLDAAIEEQQSLRNVVLAKRKSDSASVRPRRTRRSDPGPATMVTRFKGARTKTYRTTQAKPKRATSTAKKASARVVKKFDGVLLPRRRLGKQKRQETPQSLAEATEGGEDADADGEADADMDADADGDVDHDVEQTGNDLQTENKAASEPLTGESIEKEDEIPILAMDEDIDDEGADNQEGGAAMSDVNDSNGQPEEENKPNGLAQVQEPERSADHQDDASAAAVVAPLNPHVTNGLDILDHLYDGSSESEFEPSAPTPLE